MAEKAFPFVGGNNAVNTAEWQKLARSWLSTGVLTGRLNQLAVSADGSALSVSVASGQAQVEGFFYENDTALALAIATANATNPRIDTVVVRLDRAAGTVVLAVISGTPAASPVAPALSQTDLLYELPLANVAVPAAAGVIVAANVTDRRVLTKNLTEAAASAAYATRAEIGWVPLAQTALSAAAASISFAAIPQTYESLRVILRTRGTATADVLLRLNDDATAVYDRQILSGNGTVASSSSAAAQTAAVVGSHSSNAAQGTALDISIPGYARSNAIHKVFTSSQARFDGLTAADFYSSLFACRWRSVAAITSITLLPGTGNFDVGTAATLYGIKGV